MIFYRSSNYNYSDWNRIETKIDEIRDKIYAIDPATPAITVKTDWDNSDFPFVEDLDGIKNKITLLTEYGFVPYNWQEWEFDKIYFDYVEANKIESNLLGAEEALDRAEIRHCGEGYSGETIWL